MNKLILFLVAFLLNCFLQVSYGGAGTFPQGTNVRQLKDNIIFKNSDLRIMTGDTDDPSAVAKDAVIGSMYFRSGTSESYVKLDAGSSTNWQAFVTGLVDLTSDVTGILPAANGGTGIDSSALTGIPALAAGVWSVSALSAGISTALSDETGTGVLVFNSSPTIITPTIASFANAGHDHEDAAGGAQLDHGLALTGLGDDDHTQYALLLGRAGGQNLIGGTAANDDLTFQTTSNVTKGTYFFPELTASEFVKTDGSSGLTTVTSISLTADVSGVLPVANGGTNSSAALSNSLVMESVGGSVVESTTTSAQLDLLNGRTYIANAVGVDNQVSTFDGLNSIDSTANFLNNDGSVDITGDLDVDNLNLNLNTISNTLLNADIDLTPNGTGELNLTNGHLNIYTENELRLQDSGGSEYIGLKAPPVVTANTTFILPDGDGVANQVITTDGSAALSWKRDNATTDIVFIDDFEGDTAPFGTTSGNNATFDNGGIFAGGVAAETVVPINGLTSLRYTQGVGSLNDWVKSEAITVGKKEQGNSIWLSFSYTYNGAEGVDEIKVVAYDNTNSAEVGSKTAFLNRSIGSGYFEMQIPIASNTTSISWGLHTKVVNSGKILLIDDVQISHKEKKVNRTIRQTLKFNESGNVLADRTGGVRFSGALTDADFEGPSVLKVVDNGASTRTDFECLLAVCYITTDANGLSTAADAIEIVSNGVAASLGSEVASGNFIGSSANVKLTSGQSFYYQMRNGSVSNTGTPFRINIIANAENPYITTPLLDVAPVRYEADGGDAISTSVTRIQFDTVDFDNDGLVTTGASWAYTAKAAGVYEVNAQLVGGTLVTGTPANEAFRMELFKNGSTDGTFGLETTRATGASYRRFVQGTRQIQLDVGDTISVRANRDGGVNAFSLSTSATFPSFVEIKKLGKNVNKLESPAIQTQIKLLVSDKTTTGVMSDLTFTGLKVGVWYEINGQLKLQDTGSGLSDSQIHVAIKNGTDWLEEKRFRLQLGSANITNFSAPGSLSIGFFATDTSVTFDVTTITAGNVAGGSSRQFTYVILKEYPNVIETTKF